MDERYFSEKLVKWYELNKRDLPWRDSNDPYNIWLSEIILQQTRVNQGLPYYLRFIERFPNVVALAEAKEDEVLRLWQGLGYYSRARNLHKCAKLVSSSPFNGSFPTNYSILKQLPGIGDYTAAAIASFAAREIVPVIDGNVFRVLARVFGLSDDISSGAGKKRFRKLAETLISQNSPDIYNQAIMDFGATWCTPRTPNCEACVFKKGCFAFNNDLQDQLPVKAKARKPRKRYFYYFVVRSGKSLLMRKRKADDIWQGLYDFFLVERDRPQNVMELLRARTVKQPDPQRVKISKEYKHILSHQTIISRFTVIDNDDVDLESFAEPALEYYLIQKIHELPKPVLISRFLTDYDFL